MVSTNVVKRATIVVSSAIFVVAYFRSDASFEMFLMGLPTIILALVVYSFTCRSWLGSLLIGLGYAIVLLPISATFFSPIPTGNTQGLFTREAEHRLMLGVIHVCLLIGMAAALFIERLFVGRPGRPTKRKD